MKKLTKIKLVNWHLFANETVEIQDNAILSGENGSGKSTLLDAIQYLLVGGRGGVKFNVAANEDAKRSLEGYVRGRLGAEDREFLRPNDVITHVALEFYDEEDDTYNILGVILDLPKGANIKERFYILEDISIDDALFLDGNYPRDYRSMRDFLKTMGRELRPYDTQKAYRDAMSRFFGMDARKYSQILPKALAFKPIDLQAFIFEFLLDDDPVDIQSLKNNVEQLKRVETQIRIDREKLELLTRIRNAGHQLTDQTNQIKINHLIERLALTASREAYSSKQEREVESLENSLVDLRARRSDVDRIIQSLEDEMYSLERAKIADDNAQVLQQYQQNHANVNERLNFLQEEAKTVKELLENEVKIYAEITKITNSPQLDAFVKYYVKNASSINPENIRSYLNGILSTIDGINEQLAIEKKANETAQNDLSGKMNILDNQL